MAGTRALVFGSGLMVPCLVQNLLSRNFTVSVGGNIQEELARIAQKFQIPTLTVDVTNIEQVASLLDEVDMVISMVPAKFHHFVVKACIQKRKNMVTASYVSPEVKALEQEIIDAGIVVLNEMGLDPGIDHMSVMRKVREIQHAGGQIVFFQSSCGGLPAPEACNNILQYKISWAPYGALMAVLRPAKYLENNQVIEIQPQNLMSTAQPLDLEYDLPLVYYPNGNSINYVDLYGLHNAHTVKRCTIRYRNYPTICKGFVVLGIYNDDSFDFGENLTWRDLISHLAGDVNGDENLLGQIPDEMKPVAVKVAGKLNSFAADEVKLIIEALVKLDMLSTAPIRNAKSIFDAFVQLMQEKCKYEPGEEDLVIMEHRYIAQYSDRKVLYKSKLIERGVVSELSCMSRLVSLPASLGAFWLATHQHAPGLMYPMEEGFSEEILSSLERDFNVKFEETEEIIN
ncbi:unnamed protein product [Blepharisma stoltei]|uniref:Saccharopine dehydrogenase n=1 Tax=Blepharisma stoltei TaxID=1481888 RepID=A0AAU9IIG2_9CILI|nr:unnamed protein product [Blepharisma stoltei]